MQDSSALSQIVNQLDPLFLRSAAKDILKECLQSVTQSWSAKSRFNVLDARNDIEDILDTYEERTGISLSDAFDKLSKKFVKHVKSASEIEGSLFADLADAIEIKKDLKSDIILLAAHKEVQRFLDVICNVPDMQAQWNSHLSTVLAEIKSTETITKDHLVNWASMLEIKGTLPLLAMVECSENGTTEEYFTIAKSKGVIGMPTKDTDTLKEPSDSFWKLRKAKIEPVDSQRLVIASNGHLLVWNPDTKTQVPLPEPLAHQVAVIPGLDLPEDRAMVFVADPKTQTGGIVQLRLFGPLKRIATFDLEVPANRRPISQISSDRDANGHILLTWGAHHENGTLDWSLHACINEDNLIQDGTFRRDTSQKLVFEDFGEPIDRSDRRQDFRDHGNRLSLVQNQSTAAQNVVAHDTKIKEVSSNATSVFGYPLSFFVAQRFQTVERQAYNVEKSALELIESVSLDWPQAIASITVPARCLKAFGTIVKDVCRSVGFLKVHHTKLQKPWSLVMYNSETREYVACILIKPDIFRQTQALHIDQLAVRPLQQKRGLGKFLLQMSVGLYIGHCDVLIDCFEDSIRQWYMRHGFTIQNQVVIDSEIQTQLFLSRVCNV